MGRTLAKSNRINPVAAGLLLEQSAGVAHGQPPGGCLLVVEISRARYMAEAI